MWPVVALVARAPAGPGSGLGAAASAALARSLRRRWRATGVLHSLSSRCEPRLLLLRSAATVAPSSADSANATAATSTEATAAAKPEGAAVSSADSPGTGEKKEEKPEKKPMGRGMFMVYVSGGIGGLTFLYYFYKANYSLHKTEILMLEAFRQLPLYSPPGPSTAELNSRLDGTDLPQDLVQGLAEWFVAIDLQEPGGVSRDDVLELMGEFGFGEEEKPAKDFLFRGEGQIEERRRLTCAGLQETVTLVTDLVANEAKKIEKEKDEVPDPDFPEPPRKIPKSMPEMVTVLEAKLKRTSFSMNSANMMRQALQMGQGQPAFQADTAQVPEAGDSHGSSENKAPSPTVHSPFATHTASTVLPEETRGFDEDEQLQLEDARLSRLESDLLSRLERGHLSPAEESRLQDVREKRAKLAR